MYLEIVRRLAIPTFVFLGGEISMLNATLSLRGAFSGSWTSVERLSFERDRKDSKVFRTAWLNRFFLDCFAGVILGADFDLGKLEPCMIAAFDTDSSDLRFRVL